jgi:hypothetical protein
LEKAMMHPQADIGSMSAQLAKKFAQPEKANGKVIAENSPLPAGILLWDSIKADASTDRLVKGIIGEQCFGIIAGESGSGKTFAALDMSLHIAAGREWFGRKVKRVGVLYIGAEGQAGLLKRIVAWRQHHGLDRDANVPFAIYPHPIDLVNDAEGAAMVVEHVKRINEEFERREWPVIGLIDVDTLAKCFGGGDENSAQAMGAFTNNCATLQDKCKSTVLAVHHHGKNAALGMRGSSALKGAADTVMDVTGLKGTRTLEISKQKDGETGQQFYFDLTRIELPDMDEDGVPISSCVLVPADAPAEVQDERKAVGGSANRVVLSAIREALEKHGGPAPTHKHIPSSAIVVDVAIARRFAYARDITAGGEDAKQKAFRRAFLNLQSKGVVQCFEGSKSEPSYVWIT